MSDLLPSPVDPGLALLLASASPAEAPGDPAGLAARVEDWPGLLASAHRHGLLPLLWHRLAGEPGVVPGEARKKLAEAARLSAVGSLRMAAELVSLADGLAREGITVVPFKGPLLAAAVYGNLALRPFDDLDLLVAPSDLPRLAAFLEAEGWRQTSPAWPPAKEAARTPRRLLPGQYLFTRGRDGLPVEAHLALLGARFAPAVDGEGMLSRLATVSLGGRPLRTLSREDLVGYLTAHGAMHLWERLIWVADVARLAGSPELDWGRVLAGDGRGRRMLLAGLRLASGLTGASLPPAALAALAGDPGAEVAARRLASAMTAPRFSHRLSARNLGLWLALWKRPSEKAGFLLRVLAGPGPRDRRLARLSGPAAVLYFPLRLLRLAWGRLGALLGRRRGGD